MVSVVSCYVSRTCVWAEIIIIRGRSRAVATSRMECFVIIVKGIQPLTIIIKHSILNVAAALDPPLIIKTRMNFNVSPKVVVNVNNNENSENIACLYVVRWVDELSTVALFVWSSLVLLPGWFKYLLSSMFFLQYFLIQFRHNLCHYIYN